MTHALDQYERALRRWAAGAALAHRRVRGCRLAAGQFGPVAEGAAARAFGLWAHMTLGECVVLLLIGRLAWRVGNPPPPDPTRFGRLFGRFLEIAAKLSHFALYAPLVIVPFVGIVVQLKRGNALPVLGLWNVASPWPADRAVARSALGAHEFLANALLILAGIHAVAALVHHYALRDRTLTRMLPGATT